METRERYYEYWGLSRPPFDNVPDPEMYFDLHRSVENAVAETLFAVEEGNECLAVIVGDVGLGKTMTLRVIVDSLEQEKYRIAFVTNPDMTFIQLMKEIIGQLTGEPCTETRREQILEMFNQVLFKTQAERRKVLIFIDEANAMKPTTLESLRLLTNMQGDDENLFTIVMAGQLELARRLEHPKRANLFQRIGVYCHLTKIDSLDLMRDYVEHRLERAGTSKCLFTDDAYQAMWEYSEAGVPRLINKVAKLALKAGQTQGVPIIDGTIVRQIGARFDRVAKPAMPERRERTRTEERVLREEWPFPSGQEQRPHSVTEEEIIPSPAQGDLSSHEEHNGGLAASATSGMAPIDSSVKQTAMADLIKFPDHVYVRARGLPSDQRLKLAGQLAAEVLKRYPHLIQQLGSGNDPVPAWTILRNVVMRQLEQHLTTMAHL
ncbi:MAG TPA: AAA family ATPase [Alphaproteobacteria bacterium]|nr:AAA family ATPase [Alphaproteobacteria bacterium]